METLTFLQMVIPLNLRIWKWHHQEEMWAIMAPRGQTTQGLATLADRMIAHKDTRKWSVARSAEQLANTHRVFSICCKPKRNLVSFENCHEQCTIW